MTMATKSKTLCSVFALALSVFFMSVTTHGVFADETLVTNIDLPGASIDQEVTYSPSRAEYDRVRDETIDRLRKGDSTARVNPNRGPWMRVETTAKIGFAYKGVGASSGRKNLRQISAAEEALFKFEQERK